MPPVPHPLEQFDEGPVDHHAITVVARTGQLVHPEMRREPPGRGPEGYGVRGAVPSKRFGNANGCRHQSGALGSEMLIGPPAQSHLSDLSRSVLRSRAASPTRSAHHRSPRCSFSVNIRPARQSRRATISTSTQSDRYGAWARTFCPRERSVRGMSGRDGFTQSEWRKS